MVRFQSIISLGTALLFSLLALESQAAAPSAGAALKLKPVQPGIEYDSPSPQEAEECTIKLENAAWVVRNPRGTVLRKFSDSDKDNVVDTWSYYRDGVEVYRDLDADYNGKADQYRWFNSAGMRWGIDEDENGKIDRWKLISPEEIAEELVEAARTKDSARFESLLLSVKELRELELSKEIGNDVLARVKAAPDDFGKLIASNEQVADLEFRDFGGLKPGMVPAGEETAGKDLMVYESVWAMVRQGEKFEQLHLGTLVNIDGGWRLLSAPSLGTSDNQVAQGIFFSTSGAAAPPESMAAEQSLESSEKIQEILSQLEQLDQQLMQASDREKVGLNTKRANLLLQLANASASTDERAQWLRQLADMVSAAVQDGSFPQGLDYLKKLEAQLEKEEKSEDLLAYYEFQRMVAEYYGVTLMKEDVDHAKAHSQWLEDLEAFVKAHPETEHSAEALRQLAMGSEISGDNEKAVEWYRQILKDYPESIHAPMAKGAVVRLTSVGNPIRLQGNAVQGGAVDLAQLRGKAVIIQYWTSTSDVCKADHAVLSELYKKYGGGRGLEIIGVNLDYSRQELLDYLKSNRLPWPQLYEAGGFESRYAQEMGVVTVPLMLLVGPDGNVVNDNIQAAEIEEGIKKLQTRQASKR